MGITSKDIASQRAMLARGEEKRLRDQFAASVLPICNRNNRTDEQIAENAYRLADAMLHERAKRQAIAATEKAMRDAEDFVAIREQFKKWIKENSCAVPEAIADADRVRTDKATTRPGEGTGNTSSPESYDQSDEKRTDSNTDGDATHDECSVREEGTETLGQRLVERLSITQEMLDDNEKLRAEIDQLREAVRRLADQDATLSVRGGDVTVTMDATLTEAEREAIEQAIDAANGMILAEPWAIETLRELLERLA